MSVLNTPSRIIPGSDYRRERWRNGLGWTREILRLPDQEAWALRLSIAQIDADAAFSVFPGVDRELVLLEGAGLRLDFANGRRDVLDTPGAQVRFAGEDAVVGGLLGGPTRDFNVMWQREVLSVAVQRRSLSGGLWLSAEEDAAWALHVLDGSAQCELPGQTAALAADDSAWLGAGGRGHALEGHAELLAIRVMLR